MDRFSALFIVYGQINKPSATKQHWSLHNKLALATTDAKKRIAASSEKPTAQTATNHCNIYNWATYCPSKVQRILKRSSQGEIICTTYVNVKQGNLWSTLTSEDTGEKFPAEAAQYAIDNLQWDYKENALKKAKQYQDMMNILLMLLKIS